MQKITKLLCALLLLFSVGMQAQAVVTVNKYINPYTGSDSNSGDSWEKAWKTLDHAMLEVSHLDAADTGMWDYQLHITQGYFVATKTLNNNGWNKSTHATQGHVNNSMILLRQGTKLTITGGYSVNPSLATSEGSQPHKYPTLIYKADVPASSFVRLINGNGGGIALKNLTFTDIQGGGDGRGSLIIVDGTENGYVAEDKTVELDNVIIHNWQGTAGAINIKGAKNTRVDIKNSLIEQAAKKDYGMFLYLSDDSRFTKVNIEKTLIRNTNTTGTINSAIRMEVAPSTEDDTNYSALTIDSCSFYGHKRGTATEQIAGAVSTVGVRKVTIKNSKFTNNQGGYGGAISLTRVLEFLSEGNLYQSNFGGQSGGAVFVQSTYPNATGTLTFINDQFYTNGSGTGGAAGRGGAIFVANGGAGGAASNNKLVIKDSKFKYNFSYQIHGGAVFARTTNDVEVTNSLFCSNVAGFGANPSANGGALALLSSGNATITNTTFEENSVRNGAADARGGAIYSEKNLNVNNSRFWRNYSNNSGGAIHTASAKLVVTNSAFDGNSGNNGGAINLEGNIIQLTNNTFEANESRDADGGAVRISTNATGDTEDTQNKIINNKFYGNFAGTKTQSSGAEGGAIWIDGTFKGPISNNLFYANQAYGLGGAVYLYAVTAIMKDNIFDWNESLNNGGGALCITSAGASSHNNVVNNKFYRNEAKSLGGAVFVDQRDTGDYPTYMDNLDNYGYGVNFVNTDFYNNKGGRGGAIYVEQGLGGPDINAINGCKFYGNSGTDTNYDTTRTKNGEIFLAYISGTTLGSVKRITNTYLQNEPTTTNYPIYNPIVGNGYYLVAPNYQSDANTITVDPAIQQGIDDFLNFNYNGVDRPWKVGVTLCKDITIDEEPVSPSIESRWGESTYQTPGEYQKYTEDVQVGSNCTYDKPIYIRLGAETNRESEYYDPVSQEIKTYTLPNPSPELTYTIKGHMTDWKTGYSVEIPELQLTKAEAEFVKDPNDGTPRRLYDYYYYNITQYIKPNHTYTFYITKVEGENDVINDEFTEKQVITTIHTLEKPDGCLQCFFSANTTGGQGIPTIHGITTLTKAGGQGNWPMARIGAWTALESSNKGFVITRISKANLTNITNPQEGMMVYDTTDNCLKIYNGTSWKCVINQYCE